MFILLPLQNDNIYFYLLISRLLDNFVELLICTVTVRTRVLTRTSFFLFFPNYVNQPQRRLGGKRKKGGRWWLLRRHLHCRTFRGLWWQRSPRTCRSSRPPLSQLHSKTSCRTWLRTTTASGLWRNASSFISTAVSSWANPTFSTSYLPSPGFSYRTPFPSMFVAFLQY